MQSRVSCVCSLTFKKVHLRRCGFRYSLTIVHYGSVRSSPAPCIWSFFGGLKESILIRTMKTRNISLEKKIFDSLSNGSEVLDLSISQQNNNTRKFNILLNDGILLRVEKKRTQRISSQISGWIRTEKNLVSKPSQKNLKEIISLNSQIKERIGMSTMRSMSRKDGFEDFYANLERRWNKISSLEKNLKVKLIKRDRIGFCDTCYNFRETAGLAGSSNRPVCRFCGKQIKKEKTYYSIPEAVAQYVNGFWFEQYIAKRLEDLGWITLTNVYIFGNSGVKFEIDVLASKGGRTLIVECKSGGSGLNDISSFIAKFYEIKTTSAAFVSIPKTQKDGHRMGQIVGGLSVIDDIKSDRDLNRKLRKI